MSNLKLHGQEQVQYVAINTVHIIGHKLVNAKFESIAILDFFFCQYLLIHVINA